MKVLAINSNYQNQNYKKKNVNFEAVRVIGPNAIKRAENIFPSYSLAQRLVYWANNFSNGKPFGKKVEAVIRAITGIPDEVPIKKVFDLSTGIYSDVDKMQSDVFLSSDHISKKGEFQYLQAQLSKAQLEIEDELLGYKVPSEYQVRSSEKLTRDQEKARNEGYKNFIAEAKATILDKFWDTEGTECNKLNISGRLQG